MNDYQHNLKEETQYLENTLSCLNSELKARTEGLSKRKREVIASRREMWENTAHSAHDFTRLTEMNQYLSEANIQAATYLQAAEQVARYRKMIDSPYFGRFDFMADGRPCCWKIYVGLHTVTDPATEYVYVYDWRAPISSVYYRFEVGRAAYDAPVGRVSGEVLLKRQYKIKDARLVYFFDCSVTIRDQMLQDVLGRNASPRMRAIVETIQREQDQVIRDTEHDLVIVQGVAGSGKTFIALHRVAYLLYEGLHLRLRANNVLIISPNAVFSDYIATVLPELGEENVTQTTFDDIIKEALAGRLRVQPRDQQLEQLLDGRGAREAAARMDSIRFKGSGTFKTILDRLVWHWAHRMVPFEDVSFDGVVLATRQQLKNRFLNNNLGGPPARELKILEDRLLEQARPLQKRVRGKLEQVVENHGGHEFEVKPFSRLLAVKMAASFHRRLKRFTRVYYLNLYRKLFSEPGLFYRLAQGLELPPGMDRIIATTRQGLAEGWINHEDGAPLVYLKARVEGCDLFPEVKQVVVDEAQDYYPLHYEGFRLLFRDAGYTVLGDINQALERKTDLALYDDLAEILRKRQPVRLVLRKGYRSTAEINAFTQGILGTGEGLSFERHGEEPQVVDVAHEAALDQAVAHEAESCLQKGYESVAIICKTQREARDVHARLKNLLDVKLIQPQDGQVEKGIMVISSYMAKGLEFDAVIVYGADRERYATAFDRRLLYVACTRTLHRLALYYCGAKSPFLNK